MLAFDCGRHVAYVSREAFFPVQMYFFGVASCCGQRVLILFVAVRLHVQRFESKSMNTGTVSAATLAYSS